MLVEVMLQTILLLCIGICVSLWYTFENIYNYILHKYFVKDNKIVYDIWLKHFIQVVSEENYCMNYGLWDLQHTNLRDANHNLLQYMFEKAVLKGQINHQILDVGCGYGVQDNLWIQQLDTSCSITAIDISATQIQHAKDTYGAKSNLIFQQGDACELKSQFKQDTFDTVLSVESAFHYSNRPKFFQNVYSVLKEGGTFAICDIVLNPIYKPTLTTDLFLSVFSDFLHIPSCNLISAERWKSDLLQSEFEVLECTDITDQTFFPYYKHFFSVWMEKKGYPQFFARLLNGLFQTVQPFSYMVAVCKKPVNPWKQHLDTETEASNQDEASSELL